MRDLLSSRERIIHMARVACVGGIGFVVQTSIFEIVGIQLELLRPSTAHSLAAK